MSTQIQDVDGLVEALQTKTKALHTSSDPDESRKAALAAAREVVAALEKPEEVAMRYASIHVLTQRMCVKIGVDLRIFHLLAAAKGPTTSSSLAEQTGAEELLIIRLMRVLCSISFAKEDDVRSYLPTPYTIATTKPPVEGGIIASYKYSPIPKLPDFFKAKGYRCPTGSKDGPFQFIYQTNLSYYETIHQSPEGTKAFNAYMSAIRGGRKFWADWYDVKARVLDGFNFQQGEVLLVDVGGGNGHDLETFIQKHPQTAGHLVLQDLKSTVAGLEGKGLDPRIRVMEHDFFQEQPVKGAKTYFIHFCLHNWPDEQCRVILRQIMRAMKPGYSRLLLNEGVLPDRDCPPWFASNDINMMSINGGRQRDRLQWVKLIESVGLEIVEISRSPYEDDAEGIVEVMLRG